MPRTAVRRFRTVAFWEGISYLVLLLVAMPLKYWLDLPIAVRAVGSAHGVLFVAYIVTLAAAALAARWSPSRVLLALAVSLVPGATFWLEAQLRREEEAVAEPPAVA